MYRLNIDILDVRDSSSTLHFIDDNEIHLWFISSDESLNTGVESYLKGLLSEIEKKRMVSFKSAVKQQQFLKSRAALKLIVSQYLPQSSPHDVVFIDNGFGKPLLKEQGDQMQFNLSHSAGMILIGVAKKRALGVDIESMSSTRDFVKIAEHYFHQKEWNKGIFNNYYNAGLSQRNYFYRLWTLKEALIKGEGKGWFVSPHEFYFVGEPHCEPQCHFDNRDKKPKTQWRFEHVFVGLEYSAAVAYEIYDDDTLIKVKAKKYSLDCASNY